MQHIVQATDYLLEKTPEEIKGNISNLNRNVREKAINYLLQGLRQGDGISDLISQTIPIGMIQEDGDYVGALWYVETVLHQGKLFAFEGLYEVLRISSNKMVSLENQEQYEHAETLEEILSSVFQLASSMRQYAHEPKLHILMGQFYESIDNPQAALESYTVAKELKDSEGFLYLATLYEEGGNIEMSRCVLEAGWKELKDTHILSKFVSVLCQLGKTGEAFARHRELRQLAGKEISPFIVYLGRVKDDQSLELMEDTLTSYQTDVQEELFLMPSEALYRLTQSASEYIGNEFVKEDEISQRLYEKTKTLGIPLTDRENDEYTRASIRRLWLMQVDLLSLKNHRFLSMYVSDLDKFLFRGTSIAKDALHELFQNHSSPESEFQINWEDSQDEDGKVVPVRVVQAKEDEDSTEKGDESGHIEKDTIYQIALNHVAKIGEYFYQGPLYDTLRDEIYPLLLILINANPKMGDGDIGEVHSSLPPLKSEIDFIESQQGNIQENYYNLLEAFTEKYGVYYRRTIQCLARNSHVTAEKYPKIFEQYPDIAMFFFIEKLVAGIFPYDSPGDIEVLVQKYHLEEVNMDDASLFVSLLFGVSVQYTFGFILTNPHLLNVPSVVYRALECIRQLDPDDRADAMSELDAIAKEEFDKEDFERFVSDMHEEFAHNGEKIFPGDMANTFLSSGNMNILKSVKGKQGTEINQEEHKKNNGDGIHILHFLTASEFEGVEGLLQAGDSHENSGDYTGAIEYFDMALTKSDTIDVVSKCVSCSIKMGDLDRAEKYMLHALSKGYGLSMLRLVLLLQQNRTQEALELVIFMIREDVEVYDIIEGTIQLLFDAITNTMHSGDVQDIQMSMRKIMAVYVHLRVRTDSPDIPVEEWMNYWKYITAFSYQHDTSLIKERLMKFLGLVIGDPDSIPVLNEQSMVMGEKSFGSATEEEQLDYLFNFHALNVYETISKEMRQAKGDRLIELLEFSLEFTISALTVLRRLVPNSNYMYKWQGMSAYGNEGTIAKEKSLDYHAQESKIYH